jgi:hypothetical protein
MTATIIETKEVKEIDWSKPMILESSDTQVIVISTGIHQDDTFHGITLHKGFSGGNCGDSNKSLVKKYFTPITQQITITFSND